MHRIAGPIPVHPALASVIAFCRALRTTVEVNADAPFDEATPYAAPTLALDQVQGVESGLGITLPDEILALVAAHIPMLEAITGLSLDTMSDVAERADVPDGWIALGAVAATPLDPGSEDEPVEYLCVPRQPVAGELRVRLQSVDGGAEERIAPVPFTAFVRTRLEHAFGRSEVWPTALKRALDATSEVPFAPALVDALPEAPSLPARRVRHAKYGEGSVVGDVGDGKLHIDFDDGVHRVVLTSFVVDA